MLTSGMKRISSKDEKIESASNINLEDATETS